MIMPNEGTDGSLEFKAIISVEASKLLHSFQEIKRIAVSAFKDMRIAASNTYVQLDRDLQKSLKSYGDLITKLEEQDKLLEKLRSKGDYTGSASSYVTALKEAEKERAKILEQLAVAEQQVAENARNINTYESKHYEIIANSTAKLDKMINRYEALIVKKNELNAQGYTTGNVEYDSTVAQIARLGDAIERYKQKLLSTKGHTKESAQHTNIFVKALHALHSALTGVSSVFKRAFSTANTRLISAAKSATSSLASNLKSKLTPSINLSDKTFKKLTKTFIKYVFGVRSFFFLYRKIRKAVTEGLGSLALVDGNLNTVISNLLTALNTLRGSLASAFSPIVTTVGPILTKLVGWLTDVVNAIGMFIARLTGKSTYLKAVSVQKDYAESLQDTADAANNAKEATQDYLSGLDEIRKWPDANGSGAGGGGGAGGGSDPTGGLTWEEVEIPESIKNFADTLKGFFENQDWEGLGEFIADKVNGVFEKLYEIVNWDTVGPKITPVITGITTTFNSLVDNIDWDLIGKTFGAGVNTVVNTLNLLLTGVDWKNLGSKIADGVRGFVTEVDWTNVGTLVSNGFNTIIDAANGFVTKMSKINLTSGVSGWQEAGKSIASTVNGLFSGIKWDTLGQTISEGVKGALSTLSTAIQNINWKQMGEDIKTLLVNIDWAGIADALFEAIGSIIGGIGAFLIGLFKDAIDALANWWNTNAFDENGKFTGEGLLNAIGDVFKNIGKWIKEHIFQPFIDGFKKVFGISSPATAPELVEAAGYVGEGILEAIANVFKNIGNWVKTNILDKITAAIEKVGLTIQAGVQLVRDGWTKVSTWIENSYLGQSVKKLIELGRDGWGSVANWINEFHLGKEVKKLIGLGRDGWGSVANWISKSYMGKAVKKLIGLSRDGWSTIRNWIAGTYMGKALSKAIGLVRDGWSTVRNWIAASWMGKVLLKGVDLFRNWVRAGISTVADWVRQFIGGSVSVGVGLRFEGGTGSHAFATGGTISANGAIVDWNSVPKYAGGTTNAHGTLFVAGEHGPEIMGHIGGRTEILNKSQLAETMYAAIVNGFATILQQFSTALFSHLNYDTNAIINTLTNRITLSNMQIPAIARGSAIPNNTQFLSAVSGGGVIGGTSEQALRQIIREESQNRNYEFIAQINRRTLFDEFIQEAKLRQMQTGQNPFEFA